MNRETRATLAKVLEDAETYNLTDEQAMRVILPIVEPWIPRPAVGAYVLSKETPPTGNGGQANPNPAAIRPNKVVPHEPAPAEPTETRVALEEYLENHPALTAEDLAQQMQAKWHRKSPVGWLNALRDTLRESDTCTRGYRYYSNSKRRGWAHRGRHLKLAVGLGQLDE